MKQIILILILFNCTISFCFSFKPATIKSYFGIWVNDSLYYEMLLSNSPYRSRHFIYDQKSLEINDTSTLKYYNEALSYITEKFSEKSIYLRCIENKEYSIELKILNDSTISYLDPSSNKNIILKKFHYFTCDYPKCEFEYPFIYYTKLKFFNGKFKLMIERNENLMFIAFPSACNVNGFFDFVKYRLLIGGSENLPEMDIIEFIKIDGSSKFYNYLIEYDSVKIYQFASNKCKTISDTLNFDLQRGNKVCTLVKTKN